MAVTFDGSFKIFVDDRISVRSFEINGLPSRRVNRNGLSEKGVAFSSALVNDVHA